MLQFLNLLLLNPEGIDEITELYFSLMITSITFYPTHDRQVPRKPRLVGGVKGHNINEISFPGSPALWAGSFTLFFPR